MTQADTVLRELRWRGTRGIHTFELRGMYIANPSQRIAELEQRGHQITHTREKLHGAATGTRYVLVLDVEAPAGPSEPSPPAPGASGDLNVERIEPHLFEMPARAPDFDELVPPRSAIYDDQDAAA